MNPKGSRNRESAPGRKSAVSTTLGASFLAGVVRKKLALTLTSEKTDRERIYHVAAGKPLGLEELRLEWRKLYQCDAPKISRDHLVLGLGYRLQESEHGVARQGHAPQAANDRD